MNKLKKQIEEQRNYNIRIYESIPVASHEDPLNAKAEPLWEQWREGSKKLNRMIRELHELEGNKPLLNEMKRPFVNGFGEATTREITNAGYKRAEAKMSKEMLLFVGGKL